VVESDQPNVYWPLAGLSSRLAPPSRGLVRHGSVALHLRHDHRRDRRPFSPFNRRSPPSTTLSRRVAGLAHGGAMACCALESGSRAEGGGRGVPLRSPTRSVESTMPRCGTAVAIRSGGLRGDQLDWTPALGLVKGSEAGAGELQEVALSWGCCSSNSA